VVADASPLHYLMLIGEIEILPVLFGLVLVAPAVMSELAHERTPVAVREWVAKPPEWLRIQPPKRPVPALPAMLGAGEREAIAVAEELGADLLMIDDSSGRREARRSNLSIRGTLGTLGLAARHGLTDLPGAVARLRTTNFRVSEDLIESILDEEAGRK
jgi:predicted nucleic acid-binding protein